MAIQTNMTVKVRRLWVARIALWLLTLPRVEVHAGRRRIASKPLPFAISADSVEVGKIEP
jgi:hypothetical protein